MLFVRGPDTTYEIGIFEMLMEIAANCSRHRRDRPFSHINVLFPPAIRSLISVSNTS